MMKPGTLNRFIAETARRARAVSKTIDRLGDRFAAGDPEYAGAVEMAYKSTANQNVNARLRRLRAEIPAV